MKKILQKLKQRFTPDAHPNPALNFHYECLQAIALKEDIPEAEDKTVCLLPLSYSYWILNRFHYIMKSSDAQEN